LLIENNVDDLLIIFENYSIDSWRNFESVGNIFFVFLYWHYFVSWNVLECGVNLIQNGDAETFRNRCNNPSCPIGWTCTGSVRQKTYYNEKLLSLSHKPDTPGSW